MKNANHDKFVPRYFQLPLGFSKTEPGDLKRILAFLDANAPMEPPVLLSQVFSRFSGQPHAWSGDRIVSAVSDLLSDRLVSCVIDGDVYLHHHSCVFLEMPDQWERIELIPRKRLTFGEMAAVFDTCRKIFGINCPPDQDDLTRFLCSCLKQWKISLAAFVRLAESGPYPGADDVHACISFIQKWLSIADPYEKIRVVLNAKSELMLFYHRFVRLKDFYENRICHWESWRKSLEKFILLQHDTSLQINRMIETISGLLENVHARDEVRKVAMVELQKIKKAIELDKPLTQI